jgi:hypothetical protein
VCGGRRRRWWRRRRMLVIGGLGVSINGGPTDAG